jgi:hypothetical protein
MSGSVRWFLHSKKKRLASGRHAVNKQSLKSDEGNSVLECQTLIHCSCIVISFCFPDVAVALDTSEGKSECTYNDVHPMA